MQTSLHDVETSYYDVGCGNVFILYANFRIMIKHEEIKLMAFITFIKLIVVLFPFSFHLKKKTTSRP